MDTHITGREGGKEGAKGWNRRVGGPVCPSVRISGTSSLIQRLKWTLESIGFFSTFGCGDLDGQFGEEGGGRASFSSPNIGIPFYEFQF